MGATLRSVLLAPFDLKLTSGRGAITARRRYAR
jgi:hypothetical protein